MLILIAVALFSYSDLHVDDWYDQDDEDEDDVIKIEVQDEWSAKRIKLKNCKKLKTKAHP